MQRPCGGTEEMEPADENTESAQRGTNEHRHGARGGELWSLTYFCKSCNLSMGGFIF